MQHATNRFPTVQQRPTASVRGRIICCTLCSQTMDRATLLLRVHSRVAKICCTSRLVPLLPFSSLQRAFRLATVADAVYGRPVAANLGGNVRIAHSKLQQLENLRVPGRVGGLPRPLL